LIFEYVGHLDYIDLVWTPIWTPVTSWGAIIKKKEKKQDKFYRDPKLLKKLANLEHLKNLDTLEIEHTTQLTPSYKESPDSVDSKKSTIKFVLNTSDEALAYDGHNPRFWLLNYLDIGLRLVNYIKKKEDEILLEIIKKYPDIIFDNGTLIALSLWIATTEKDRIRIISKLQKSLKEPENPTYAEDAWNRYWINILSLNSFYNPIKRKLFDWSIVTQLGTQSEKEKAKRYLKELGLNFLLNTPVGRNRKFIESEELNNLYFDNPYFLYIHRQWTQTTIVDNDYKKVHDKIKKIFKENKFQADKRKTLREYIIEESLVETLKKPLSISLSDSYETSVNKIVDNLIGKKPKDISWIIVGAKFSMSPSTLKQNVK